MSDTDKGKLRVGADRQDGHGADGGTLPVPDKRKAPRPADVGRALRSVYDDTLREAIPDDLKDLLGRLG